MKPSKFFLSTLIAASVMTATAYADLSTYDEVNNTVSWVAGQENAYKYVDGTTWLKGTVGDDGQISWTDSSVTEITRVNNTGWLLYLDGSNQTISVNPAEDSSDGGGIWVTGTGNSVTATLGNWAGSIQVDAGNTLNTSWGAQLKDGTIVANGTVNLTNSTINLDGSTTREWYTGESGIINSEATNLLAWWASSGAIKALGTGVVNFNELTSIQSGFSIEAAGSATVNFNNKTVSGGSIILSTGTIQNLTVGTETRLVIDYAEASGTGALSNVVISEGAKLDVSGVVAGQSYNLFLATNVSGASNFSTDNVTIDGNVIPGHGASVSLTDSGVFSYSEGVSYGDMVWTGKENSTWDTTAKNWTSKTEGSGGDIAFAHGDSVVFRGLNSSTVSLENGASLFVGNMTVESGSYNLILGTNGTASVSGEKLTIVQGASLTLGDQGNNVTRKVSLGFKQISVGGSLKFYTTGAHSWSSLTFEEGGNLHFIDGTGSQEVPHISIGMVNVAGNASITSEWDKKLKIDSLSGKGTLSVTGATYAGDRFRVSIGDVSAYSGTATFNNGNNGLTVNLTGNTSVNSEAKLVFNSGVTVNNTGTLTLDGEIVLSGGINNTGTISVTESVKFDISQMTAAENVYTFVSGGTVTDSWSKLDRSNFSRNGNDLSRGAFSNTGNLGEITFVSEASKTLTWSGQSGTWDYNNSQSWKDSSDAVEKFYTNDSVVFDTENASVTVSGTVIPASMTVSKATAFSGTGTVKVANSALTIADGTSLTLGEGVVLDLGKESLGTLAANIIGAGTIVWGNSAGSHGTTVNLSDEFTGTLKLSGYIGAGENLALGGTTKLVMDGVWCWSGGGRIDKESLTVEVASGTNKFEGGMTVKEFVVSDGTTTISNTNTFGALNISGGDMTISGGQTTVSSGTTIENAMLTLNSGNAATGALRGSVTINNGGTLKMSAGDVTGWDGGETSLHTLTINKGGTLDIAAAQTFGGMNLTLNGGKITGTSTIDLFAAASANGKLSKITVGGGTSSENVSKSTVSVGLYLRQDDTVMSVAQYGELEISGDIGNTRPGNSNGGNNALIKQGAGMLTLSGNNTYSGGTTVATGTLVAGSALALGTGDVSVYSGAKLQADTAVELSQNLTLFVGDNDVSADGTAASTNGGLVTGTGVVTVGNEAKVYIDISQWLNPAADDTTQTAAIQIAASGALNLDAAISENNILVGAWNESVWVDSTQWKIQDYDSTDGVLTLYIPEPSAFGLLAGAGALALVVSRRKRRK